MITATQAPAATASSGGEEAPGPAGQAHPLACVAQNYAWGRLPQDSEVSVVVGIAPRAFVGGGGVRGGGCGGGDGQPLARRG